MKNTTKNNEANSVANKLEQDVAAFRARREAALEARQTKLGKQLAIKEEIAQIKADHKAAVEKFRAALKGKFNELKVERQRAAKKPAKAPVAKGAKAA